MPTPNETVAARITHPHKNLVRITPDRNYDATVFIVSSGKVEVLITSKDGEESWRVHLVEANSEAITVRRQGDSTEVIYVPR